MKSPDENQNDQNSQIQDFVDNFYGMCTFLNSIGETSYYTEINRHYPKILLLYCASYHESRITKMIQTFVEKNSSDNRIVQFINQKAFKKNYHSLFTWTDPDKPSTINTFLKFFGDEFKKTVWEEINSNDDYLKQVTAFLKIGDQRNQMVHGDLINFPLEMTINDIIVLHNKAIKFIEFLESKFLG